MKTKVTPLVSRIQEYLDKDCHDDPRLKRLLQEVLIKEKEYVKTNWLLESVRDSCYNLHTIPDDWPLDAFAAYCHLMLDEIYEAVYYK